MFTRHKRNNNNNNGIITKNKSYNNNNNYSISVNASQNALSASLKHQPPFSLLFPSLTPQLFERAKQFDYNASNNTKDTNNENSRPGRLASPRTRGVASANKQHEVMLRIEQYQSQMHHYYRQVYQSLSYAYFLQPAMHRRGKRNKCNDKRAIKKL